MNEIVYEVTGRFVVAGKADAEVIYRRLDDLTTADGECHFSIREKRVQAPPSTEIVTHTPEESQALFSRTADADVQALDWLLTEGLPGGFVGPVSRFHEDQIFWATSIIWGDPQFRVAAIANTLGELGVSEGYAFKNEKQATTRWFYSREDWRAAIITAVDRLTVCGRIEREAAEMRAGERDE